VEIKYPEEIQNDYESLWVEDGPIDIPENESCEASNETIW
jgi:hypothetical protein